MSKKNSVFVCSQCGAEYVKWQGECSACGSWNTIEEIFIEKASKNSAQRAKSSSSAVCLPDISFEKRDRYSSGISELDRVLGENGFVKGSLVLVSGEPGIGKSTLLMQVCSTLCTFGKVLYASGEESGAQIKMRAERLAVSDNNILVLTETNLDSILKTADSCKPAVVIIDSIQTVYSDLNESIAGSISQVKECALQLMQYAKSNEVTVILVGHVNKDGAIAGPKVLEHLVDTVLNFEGDRHTSYRLLRSVKNRFGSTDEIGMFEMTETGLKEVLNPSAALLEGRPADSSGSCVAAVMEGARPILTEVQGLVTKSIYGSSRRTAAGFDYNRAVLLLAILEKRVGFMLSSFDAYINVIGGISIGEPGADLAVIMAVASSYLDKTVPKDTAFFGEVGLSGELRAVSGALQRINEIKRLGFDKCVLPEACRSSIPENKRNDGLFFAKDIKDAISFCFGSK